MKEELNLKNKTAVVVGSSGGWGRGVAIELAKVGARVVVNGRRTDAVAEVVKEIRATGGEVVGCPVDVHTPEGAQELTTFALEHFGSIDVLVNSTGGKGSPATILELTPEALDSTFNIQLKAPFLMTHYVAKAMIQSKVPGRIVTMVGGAAVRPFHGLSVHGATKGGMLAATWTWAQELEPFGITVNAVRGAVRTPGTETRIAEIRRQLAERGLPVPSSNRELGWFEPEEAAPLVVWLALDSAAGVTGQFIGIDGGKVTIWGLAAIEAQVYDAQGYWDIEHLDAFVRPLLEASTAKSLDKSSVEISNSLKQLS